MSRALRRHHRQRLKLARKNYHNWGGRTPNTAGRIARFINTPTPCSLDCCGNQRHAWGRTNLTMQERRFLCGEENL